ncbi:ADP-glyceromanno-heptose 6-epimerase [Marinoscillum sp.]|uniref:ADP-glyceromanno-heptose 6-epimerase n=1 Tax=Marinoscillum sp. TaxID=2024838 RepID=UPI003BA9F90C
MIIVTGAAGFIGSNLILKLNQHNFHHIVAVDKFDNPDKNSNLSKAKVLATIDRDSFIAWARDNAEAIEFIFHLGARTDTLEQNMDLLRELNTEYTKRVWELCTEEQIPLIYASSAATYGDGSLGFSDDKDLLPRLKPLNAYAQSKHEFDLWAITQENQPFYWSGLKFFNVYGPNEEHKGKMASMIHQAFIQIESTGKVRLFKSHHPDYAHGEQKRDFIHVDEVTDTLIKLMHHRKNPGIYNLGTGKARSFNEMVRQVFESLNKPVSIEYIDMPEHLKDAYQYFTEAEMTQLYPSIS